MSGAHYARLGAHRPRTAVPLRSCHLTRQVSYCDSCTIEKLSTNQGKSIVVTAVSLRSCQQTRQVSYCDSCTIEKLSTNQASKLLWQLYHWAAVVNQPGKLIFVTATLLRSFQPIRQVSCCNICTIAKLSTKEASQLWQLYYWEAFNQQGKSILVPAESLTHFQTHNHFYFPFKGTVLTRFWQMVFKSNYLLSNNICRGTLFVQWSQFLIRKIVKI